MKATLAFNGLMWSCLSENEKIGLLYVEKVIFSFQTASAFSSRDKLFASIVYTMR